MEIYAKASSEATHKGDPPAVGVPELMTCGCTLLLYRPAGGDGLICHFALTRPNMVGVTGFEPATSSSRTKRATKLRHTPRSTEPRRV